MVSQKLTRNIAEAAVSRAVTAKYKKATTAAWTEISAALLSAAQELAKKNPHKFTPAQMASGLVYMYQTIRVDLPTGMADDLHAGNRFRPQNMGVGFDHNYENSKKIMCIDLHLDTKVVKLPGKGDAICKTERAKKAAAALVELVKNANQLQDKLEDILVPGRSIAKIKAEHPYLAPFFAGASPTPLDLSKELQGVA